MPRRFEGWEGIIHGGILCTILDEVMAWALVAQDSWGVTARMSIDFRRPVTVGQAIRAEGWIAESTAPHPDHGRTHPRRRPPARSSPRRKPRTSPPPRPASASSRSATASARGGRNEPRHAATTATTATTSAITAASNRFVAEHLAAATALGERLADLVHDPDAFVAAVEAGLRDHRRSRRTQTARGPSLRASAPCSGVRLPLMEAAHKAFKRGTRKTSTSLLLDVDRPPPARGAARDPLVRHLEPRTRAAHGPGADVAAPAPRGPRGGRVDHRRHAGPPIRRGDPARRPPLGRARAARLLALTLGAPPGRLHRRHAAPFARSVPGAREPSHGGPRPRLHPAPHR